jgi:hypothetical protein
LGLGNSMSDACTYVINPLGRLRVTDRRIPQANPI